MSLLRNLIKIGIYVPCVTSLLVPPQVRANQIESVYAAPSLKLLLKNPFHFDVDAEPMLVDRFKKFHQRIDEKWTEHGLQTKLRRLVQSHESMNSEVYSEIVERAHEALQLRDALEIWVTQVGRSSRQGLGTIARYMSEVYVPLLAVQAEGRMFPELVGLNLTAALWPHFDLGARPLEDVLEDQKPELRRPAAEMQVGESVSDPQDFLESVSPLLDARLRAYAESLQQSAQRSSKIAEVQAELDKLRRGNGNAGRGRRVLTPAEREKMAKDAEERAKRIAALEQELRRLGNGDRIAEIDAQIKNIQRNGGTVQTTTYMPYGGYSVPVRVLSNEERKKIEELREERARITPEGQKKEVVEFFAEASKLTTLQLMIKQIQFYQELADVPSPLNMKDHAPACMASYKELTPILNFRLASKEERLFNMEMFLANNGLLFSESEHVKQEDFDNFFLSTHNRDPFKGYYAGLMPFHRVRVAQQGKLFANNERPQDDWMDIMEPTLKPSWQDLGAPSFDDVEHFSDVLGFMLPEATKHLQNEDAEILNQVVSILPPPAIEVEEGDEHYLDFLQAQEWVGLTPYLRDKLIEKGKTREQWVSIVPQDVWLAIVDNNIRMEFPAFYGSEAYKQWALRLIFRALNDEKLGMEAVNHLCRPAQAPSYSMVYGSPQNVDYSPRFTSEFCGSRKSREELLADLKKSLRPFEENGPFVAPALSYAQGLRKDWGNLRSLWNHLRDTHALDNIEGEQGPNMNEFTFMRSQFGANPWVVLRLSILIKLSELKSTPFSTSTARTGRGGGTPKPADVKAWEQRKRLRAALEALPLSDLSLPLRPAYGNVVYTKNDEGWKFWKDQRDKNFYKIWDSIERKYHDNNAHIFKSPIDRSSGWDHYTLMERLETRSVLSDEDVNRVVGGYKLEKRGVDSKEMHELLQLARDSDDSAKFELIRKIMETPGERSKHEELLQEYIFRQGQEDAFDDPRDVKLAFFRRDASYKFPLMTQVLKIAGMNRTEELKKNMEPLCALNTADEKQWDKLMSMTGETQKMFNDTFGIDGIPPEVMKYYDRGEGGLFGMHPRDVTNMGLMIVGFIGLAIAGGMCASGVASVAGCPLMVTLLTVTAAGALSYSTADFIIFAVQQAMGREERMRLGNTFDQLGFSNKESVDRMKGRGWWGVAFEVVTAATMFVPIGLAIKVVGRTTIGLLLSRAAKLEGLAKPGMEAGRTVFEVIDAKAAEVTLGLVEKSPKTGTILSRFFSKVKDYSRKGNFLHALKKDFADDIIVNAAPELLNQQTGKVLAQYFKGNKQAFVNFVQRNLELKFGRIEKLILKAEKTGNPKYLSELGKYFHGMHLKPDRLAQFQAELVKERRIVAGLAADLAKREGPELAEYIARHADLLAPLLSDFTYHWWRVPGYAVYLVFFQGSPWAYTNKPFAKWLSGRAFVKHVFASREKLLIHHFRRQAQEGLELSSRVAMFNQLSLFQTADTLATRVSSEMASSADEALKSTGEKAIQEWQVYRRQIAQRVLEANPGARLDLAKVERLIFNATAGELEEARALLKKTRPETLFGFSVSTENMDRVLMRLSKESRNLDKQADYIALLAQRVKLLNIPIRSHEVLSY